MENEPHIIPREALTGIAVGTLLMTLFTSMWTGIAFHNLNTSSRWLVTGLFGVLIISFLFFSIYFFRMSKHLPGLNSEADKAEKKRVEKWFGIIFGLEGITIPIAVNIVIMLHHANLVIPVIALVVGLHFYPMVKIFKRTIDYYLATWSTVIAICSMIFLLNNTYPQQCVLAFLGIGMAMATSSYGLYMIYVGKQLIKRINLGKRFK